ncbi:unnamed protein product, partial [Prorocentrum cordatum]
DIEIASTFPSQERQKETITSLASTVHTSCGGLAKQVEKRPGHMEQVGQRHALRLEEHDKVIDHLEKQLQFLLNQKPGVRPANPARSRPPDSAIVLARAATMVAAAEVNNAIALWLERAYLEAEDWKELRVAEDNSPQRIQNELALKRAKRALEGRFPERRFFIDGACGELSAQRAPFCRVAPLEDGPAKTQWGVGAFAELDLDRAEVDPLVMQAVAGRE